MKASFRKDVFFILAVTNHPVFFSVVSFSIGINFVTFQMNDNRKLDNMSYSFTIFTTKEQNLITTRCELVEIAFSQIMYEHKIIGPDHFFFLNDRNPIFSSFTKKRKLYAIFYISQMKLTIYQNLRIIYTKRKKLCS